MKTEKLTYYKLEDHKDCHRRDFEALQVVYKTKEEATEQAIKYIQELLDSNQGWVWFSPRRDRGYEYRPIGTNIVPEDGVIRLLYKIQRRKKKTKKTTKTVEIDGKEYSRDEETVEYGEWETIQAISGCWTGGYTDIIQEYNVYIEEHDLDFFVGE